MSVAEERTRSRAGVAARSVTSTGAITRPGGDQVPGHAGFGRGNDQAIGTFAASDGVRAALSGAAGAAILLETGHGPGRVPMHLTDREWWGLIHGMGFGAVFLLAFAGGLGGLYSLRARPDHPARRGGADAPPQDRCGGDGGRCAFVALGWPRGH